MARKDFYDIKGLGSIPSDDEAEPPISPRPYRVPKTKKKHRSVLAVLLIILLVVLLGGGGAYLFHKKHASSKSKQAAATVNPKAAPQTNNGLAQYISNGSDLNLSFSYPASWSVTPASGGNSNDQTITLTSPLTNLVAATGSDVTGKVSVTIRPGTDVPSELNSDNPTVAIASVQFAYTAPTTNQYQYPYLTFIHFSTGANVASVFEEVMVTGTTQFTQGQALSADQLSGLDPIIAANFIKCTTSACTGSGASPLSVTANTWQNTPLFQKVQALFNSLKLN